MRSLVCILFSVSVLMCGADVPRLSVFHLHLVEMAKLRQVPLETVAHEAQSWGVSGIDLWFENREAEGARLLAAGMKPASVVARRCGSPRIMLVPGYLRKDEDRDAAWPTVRANLREFLVRAEKAGLTADIRASSDYLRSLTKNR